MNVIELESHLQEIKIYTRCHRMHRNLPNETFKSIFNTGIFHITILKEA